MATSGQTPISTTDDGAVTLLSASEQNGLTKVVIINEEGTPGFFSLDSGATWNRWPDGALSIDLDCRLTPGQTIQWKRVPGGANATKLYAWGY